MQDHEWRKLEIQMKRRITVLRNKAKANITLAEKLKLKDAIKISEEALSQHRLNYHELTTCNDYHCAGDCGMTKGVSHE